MEIKPSTETRSELLSWINRQLPDNIPPLSKVEQCGTGVPYVALLPYLIPAEQQRLSQSSRVKLRATHEFESASNLKVFHDVLQRHNINRPAALDDPTRLIKGNFQANLQLLQWFKGFADAVVGAEDGGDGGAFGGDSGVDHLGGSRKSAGGTPGTPREATAAPTGVRRRAPGESLSGSRRADGVQTFQLMSTREEAIMAAAMGGGSTTTSAGERSTGAGSPLPSTSSPVPSSEGVKRTGRAATAHSSANTSTTAPAAAPAATAATVRNARSATPKQPTSRAAAQSAAAAASPAQKSERPATSSAVVPRGSAPAAAHTKPTAAAAGPPSRSKTPLQVSKGPGGGQQAAAATPAAGPATTRTPIAVPPSRRDPASKSMEVAARSTPKRAAPGPTSAPSSSINPAAAGAAAAPPRSKSAGASSHPAGPSRSTPNASVSGRQQHQQHHVSGSSSGAVERLSGTTTSQHHQKSVPSSQYYVPVAGGDADEEVLEQVATERQFYYDKLRMIERLVVNVAAKDLRGSDVAAVALARSIRDVLYATN